MQEVCPICKGTRLTYDIIISIDDIKSGDIKWWHYNCYQAKYHSDNVLGITPERPEPAKPSPEYLIKEQLIKYYPGATPRILDALSKHKYKIVDTELYDIVDKRSEGLIDRHNRHKSDLVKALREFHKSVQDCINTYGDCIDNYEKR